MRFKQLSRESSLTNHAFAICHFLLTFRSLRCRRRNRSRHPRSGVILVLVLLMLTLCACIASQVASRTIRLTGQAADSQRELQSRWAIISIRRSILNDASTLLIDKTTDPTTAKLMAHREDNIILGGNRYQLILQDESAKAPIARMLQNKNQQEVKPILRRFLQGRTILKSDIPAKPTQWSEIVDLTSSKSTSNSFANLLEATQRMTLWSDGRLNIMTADRETLDAVWRYQFNAAAPESIANVGNSDTVKSNLDTSFKALGLTARQSEFATAWLTTTSSSYSLWISQSTPQSSGMATIYVRNSQPGYAEEHFGFHLP